MAETEELIVEFKRGLPEDKARDIVTAVGGAIRRRMRSDHEDQVTLLVQIDGDELATVSEKIGAHPSVTHIERNSNNYGIA